MEGQQQRMRGAHVFVDESKKRGLLVVAAVVLPRDLQPTRKALSALLLRGQRRIHFKDERESRQRQIIDTIADTGVTARIYGGGMSGPELDVRMACLERLVEDLANIGASRLVIERDDSLVEHDRRCLYHAVRKSGQPLEYLHLRAHEESLLWIADAIAWCWAARGAWRDRIRELVTEVTDV